MTAWDVCLSGTVGQLTLDLRFETDASPLLLIGPNGAGKTTLLQAIAGAHHPFVGWIRMGTRTLLDSANRVSLEPQCRGVGYVPQGYGLFPHLTVAGNVAFAVGGWRRSHARQVVRHALAQLGVAHLAFCRPTTLSGGEQQRVALARALAGDPRALLLDEPLAALDVANRRQSRAFLRRYLEASGLPAIVVTHDVRDVMALGGEVLVVEKGRVTQQGVASSLAAAPASPFVAEIFDMEHPDVA